VRFGYWHFAFLSEQSFLAAQASECAADQEAFWEYHDLLFANLTGGNNDFSAENLKAFAVELDLDASTFNQCLDSEKHLQLVQAETEIARQIGVSSTPAFAINGTPVMGAQPFENFQQVIENALQTAGE